MDGYRTVADSGYNLSEHLCSDISYGINTVYMTCGIFIGTANIQYNVSILVLHHFHGFIHGDLRICCILVRACRCCVSDKKQGYQ